MMTATILKMRWVLIAVLCLASAGCDASNSETSLKIKRTLEVETPNGIRSGASVTRVWAKNLSKSQQFLSGGNVTTNSHEGEAVVVNLDDGKYLFALFSEVGFFEFAKVWGFDGIIQPDFVETINALKDIGGERTLTAEEFATLLPANKIPRTVYGGYSLTTIVAFEDTNDSKTVEVLKSDDIADFFGAGYALKSVRYSVTNDPITRGHVEEVLKWIITGPDMIPKYLKEKWPATKLERYITSTNFIDGSNWYQKRKILKNK